MKLVAIPILAALLPHGVVRAADMETPHVTYYAVKGNSARALRTQLDALGPVHPTEQRRYDGETNWIVRWSYRYDSRRAGCELRSFDVALETKMTLPRWNAPAKAPASLRKDWDRYSTALRLHEDGHGAIGEATAYVVRNKFRRRLADASPAVDCTVLSNELDTMARSAVEEGHAKDLEYDRTTAHGKTQGARFPR